MDTASASGVFGSMLSQPGRMAFWTEVVVIAGFLVCSFGLQNGLERISKGMMLALLALILILAIHSLTLPGAAEGMKFYLLPTAKSVQENGLGTIITGAMNQAFFTLSLGIAAMEIFGSYTSKSPYASRRGGPHLRARYLRRADGGHDHLPCLLLFRH